MKRLLVLIAMLHLSGCHHIKVGPEFSNLRKQTQDRYEESISMSAAYNEQSVAIPDIDNALKRGLSREDAVRIALMNNPGLRAEFENLGIAKADLVQAGLYTNPSINTLFHFPTREGLPGTAQMNIESLASFRLSDLWQVPLAKKVSEDLLEIVSLRILNSVVNLVADTKMAYDSCLATQFTVDLLEQLIEVQKELHSEIHYRQFYGYTNDLDKNQANADMARREVELLKAQAEQQAAAIHLKLLLGIRPAAEPIVLAGDFQDILNIPPLSMLEERALQTRPEVKIAQMKMQQYKKTISLERAKTVKTVDVGVSFKQDFDKPIQGWGPYLNFDLPIFDTNYAEISRAQFLYNQAEKEFYAIRIRTKEQLAKPYNYMKKLQCEIAYYKEHILPADQQAIDFAYTYAQMMQETAMAVYLARIKFYEDRLALVTHLWDFRKNFTELERVIGEKVDQTNEFDRRLST